MNKCIHCDKLTEGSLDSVDKDILCESCFLELCHYIENYEQGENLGEKAYVCPNCDKGILNPTFDGLLSCDECEYEEIDILNEHVQLKQELEEAEKENDKEKIMGLVQELQIIEQSTGFDRTMRRRYGRGTSVVAYPSKKEE